MSIPGVALGADSSWFELMERVFGVDNTNTINLDQVFEHPLYGFIILEGLKCEEEQWKKHNTTPWSGDPNRYWDKNKGKFLEIWRKAHALKAHVVFVGYAPKGTLFEDQIRLLHVSNINESGVEYSNTEEITFDKFADWIRALNAACDTRKDGWESYFLKTFYNTLGLSETGRNKIVLHNKQLTIAEAYKNYPKDLETYTGDCRYAVKYYVDHIGINEIANRKER